MALPSHICGIIWMAQPRSRIHPTAIGCTLASIISALGMWLTGQTTYASARLFFLLIAALIPPLTAALAYTFSQRRDLAIASGLLAIFSVYHAPFVGVTDNFSLFMLFGGLYFIFATQLSRPTRRTGSCLAYSTINISRSDGSSGSPSHSSSPPRASEKIHLHLHHLLFSSFGFAIIMSPWYAQRAFTAPHGSGGTRHSDSKTTIRPLSIRPQNLQNPSLPPLGYIIADRVGIKQ
jgi:hypothetical protein